MTRHIALIGALLLSLLTAGVPVHAAEDSLSSLVLKSIEQEWTISDAIQKFAEKVVRSPYTLSPADITAAVSWENDTLCGKKSKSDGGTLGYEDCNRLREAILSVVNREKQILGLGRELQAIATSYELPIREGQRGEVAVNSAAAGIISVWRVRALDEKATGSGLLLRAVSIEASVSKPKGERIATAYDNAGSSDAEREEQRRAMVWRYSAGVRLVRGDRAPAFPAPAEYADGASKPERQYLFKRWEDVETPLMELWDHARGLSFDPPLKKGEIVILTFKAEGLPPNVQFWGFLEKKQDNSLDGDVGIQWKIPLDPVFPSLVKDGDPDTPIPGGAYPPEPVESGGAADPKPRDGRSLCASPLARRGYLCRKLESESSIECREQPTVEGDTILLTACTEKDPNAAPEEWCCLSGGSNEDTGTCSIIDRDSCEDQGGIVLSDQNQCADRGCKNIDPPKPKVTTVSGPDVCATLPWTDSPARCKEIHLECGGPQPGGSFDEIKHTGDKVNVKLFKQTTVPYKAALQHALTHVVQACGQSPSPYLKEGEELDDLSSLPDYEQRQRNEACCRTEGEAFAWQFRQMETEGRLSGLGPIAGIPVNATTLAEANADLECRTFFPQADGCRVSFPKNYAMQIASATSALGNGGKECDEILEEAEQDPVIRGMVDAAKGHGDICSPDMLTKFPATIGNTACFIGACAENSTELRRIIPGRTAFGVQDEGFPFDGLIRPAIESASFLTGVPDVEQTLPTYNPRQLLWQLDTELCQKVGLPPQSPTTACVLAVSRRLNLPLQSYATTMQAFTNDQEQQSLSLDEGSTTGLATGMRMGTQLYADVSSRFVDSFSELLRLANLLLRSLKETSFPTEMCPIGKPS